MAPSRVVQREGTTAASFRAGYFETLVITETSVNGKGGGARHVQMSKFAALA